MLGAAALLIALSASADFAASALCSVGKKEVLTLAR
jgi:hypothetical protein